VLSVDFNPCDVEILWKLQCAAKPLVKLVLLGIGTLENGDENSVLVCCS
jgi:hypothetical protein